MRHLGHAVAGDGTQRLTAIDRSTRTCIHPQPVRALTDRRAGTHNNPHRRDPTMSNISLDTIYSDEDILVTTDDLVIDGFRMQQGIFKVSSPSKKFRARTFKGESAWSDSRRYAEDQLYKVGVHKFLHW